MELKQKINEALKQEYGSELALGKELSSEVFDRVSSFLQTVISSEEQIPEFIKGAEPMLKMYQSTADKARNPLNAKITELEAKLKGNQLEQPIDGQPQPEMPDIAAIVANAVASAINPLQEKLNAFEKERNATNALKTAQEAFNADAWVNGYPELRDMAWAQAERFYDRTGKTLTAEELKAEAMEIFKPLAKAKGLDISKPFQSDGSGGKDDATTVAEITSMLKKSGKIAQK